MGFPEKAKSRADLDLEYVQKQLLAQRSLAGHHLERGGAVLSQDKQLDLETCQRTCEGYKVLLKELFLHAQEGVISIHDELEPVALEECLIDEEDSKIFQDPKNLLNFAIQDLNDFSIPVQLTFYEIAKNLSFQKRLQDAIYIFTFLCQLNPPIPAFWIGLGVIFEEMSSWDEAMASYQTAIEKDPVDFDSYIALVRCWIATKDYTLAIETLETLKNGPMKEQADEALKFISALKGG